VGRCAVSVEHASDSFCERIPFAWVVIYAMDYVGIDAKQVGILTTIEMLTATLCIIPASHFADKWARTVRLRHLHHVHSLVALWVSSSFALVMLAFAIRGLKEFEPPRARRSLVTIATRSDAAND
jgi:hypothetical protein